MEGMDFCKITEELWKIYLSSECNKSTEILIAMDPDCSVIGTGAHEFYIGFDPFLKAWIEERTERENIDFQFKDFWCQQRELASGVYLVYGSIYIWWESEDQSVYIDMNSRFSVIYQVVDEKWKIVHLHHSIPNAEQMDGEYYPRTLRNQIERTQEMVVHMKDLAHRDGLTNLINYRGLQDMWNLWKHEGNWIFVLDLDNFKMINDTYGHMAGNDVLKKISDILLKTMRTNDIVCRMGGDEFIVLCSNISEEEGAHRLAQRLLQQVRSGAETSPYWVGVSIGGTRILAGETLESAISRADQGLYQIKKHSKNGYALI